MYGMGFGELLVMLIVAVVALTFYVGLPVALLVLLFRIQRSIALIEQHLAPRGTDSAPAP